MLRGYRSFFVAAFCALVAQSASAQLRVCTWNVTNYSSGRVAAFQTSFYDTFEGRSLAPDVLVVQEMLSSTGTTNFLNNLNTAPGSPGDWAAAPFFNGPDTDNAFFYRTSRVDFLAATTIAFGGVNPNHPRNVERYDVRIKGYAADSAVIALYSSHMKAGSGSTDQARRLVEAQRIRDDAQALNSAWSFILGGDFNIQSSSQSAYQEMIGSQTNNDGRFFDPISTPGSWNNNFSFRYVHTQDPVGAGGMDDRHDQLLLSTEFVDGDGLEYIGSFGTPYSNSTWDDPNHTYRSWGNDGSNYNSTMAIAGNTMVGATIAQALANTQLSGGHLPVFIDVRVPAKIDSDILIDFGDVEQFDVAQLDLTVFNDGDTALWTVGGIDDLDYTLPSPPTGFSYTSGNYSDAPGGGANTHQITVDSSSLGVLSETIFITSDDPDQPSRMVSLLANIIFTPGACEGDVDGNNIVDVNDVAYVIFRLGDSGTPGTVDGDADANGIVDINDIAYVIFRLGPCP